jgi:hypothetical protein
VLRLSPRAEGGAVRELPVTLAPGTPGGLLPAGVEAGSLWIGADGVLSLACQDYLYALHTLRPADRAVMSAKDFVHGFLAPGTRGVCGTALRD